jgi:DNA-directed RNA polymerase specialized sigma24 family protein
MPATVIETDIADLEDCLHSCLQKLSAEQRELIMAYYAKEKQAKIDHRLELARSLGISVKALRVKVFRIRLSLEHCIERSLKRKAQGNETNCTNFHYK